MNRITNIIEFSLSVLIVFLVFAGFPAALDAQETPPPGSGPQETPIQEEEQIQKWTKAFQEAERVFNSVDQSSSIALFQELVAQITQVKMKRALIPPERDLLHKSMDFLGQAFYQQGQADEATSVFRELIKENPNYNMDADTVSPKIIQFFSEIRDKNLGKIAVTSKPPDAKVLLDGVEVGTTDLALLHAMTGPHELEVVKPGYHPGRKSIQVNAGRIEKHNFDLERSAAAAYFVTYPRDVEVFLNGNLVGVTGGEPSPRAQEIATQLGLPLSDFSADFALPELQTGVFQVEFRKPCWETDPKRITVERFEDLTFAPIVMVPSKAHLNITANDPQASIFIDNEYIKGTVPQKVQLCSGKHNVKLKGPLGKFEKQVELKKDQTLDLVAKLNPSFAFLGVIGSASKEELTRYREEGVKYLANMQTLNFYDASANAAASEENLRQFVKDAIENSSPQARKTKIKEMCEKLEADLLLIGNVRDAGPAEFFLLSNWSSGSDQRNIKLGEASVWNSFKADLEFEHPLQEKRLGASFIDSTITPGPVIAKLTLKTFDDSQRPEPGDIVLAVNDQAVANSTAVLEAARQLQAPDQINLTVQRGTAQVKIPIKMLKGPRAIELDDSDLLFNRQLAVFHKVLGMDTFGNLDKNIAKLNLALCHMHFGEYEEALQLLQTVQLDRPLGIGMGTVKYYTAIAYRELGRIREAQGALAEAARATQNTFIADDGLPVAPQAERILKSIQ